MPQVLLNRRPDLLLRLKGLRDDRGQWRQQWSL